MDLSFFKQDLPHAFNCFLDLLYPNLCIACGGRTHAREELFCLTCQYQVYPTQMHLRPENEFTNHFKGRISLVAGASLYYYSKGSRVQKALELLKYRGEYEIGIRIGQHFGSLLKNATNFKNLDYIIPVPLHPNRKNQRGYNQSAQFAIGLSESLECPTREDILIRTKETITQTTKNRIERNQNIQAAFKLQRPDLVKGRHVLLVDDILTTGATLEACALTLQQSELVSISMATIAMTS